MLVAPGLFFRGRQLPQTTLRWRRFRKICGTRASPSPISRAIYTRHGLFKPRHSSDAPLRSISLTQKRTFLSHLPPVLVPPVVFIGLLIALWTYKCFMTVIFQDKIIYMPYMPPFARSEKISDYEKRCAPVVWKEERIRSLDGTKISLCVGEITQQETDIGSSDRGAGTEKHMVICYFQGNGASLPPRLPILSNVLRALHSELPDSRATRERYTIVALSYRGYWKSSGRATQSGIELDAQATLEWIESAYGSSVANVQLVLWGQSIGAGVASTAAAAYFDKMKATRSVVTGLILETPFVSIKRMLLALYPQKWLPYQYLYPFLWNHWDNEVALRSLARLPATQKPRILLLPASRDEVVPQGQADELERVCRDAGLAMQRKDILGALHTEATVRSEGVAAVAGFVSQLSDL